MNFMKKIEGEAYALLRIVAGFLFLLHGAQKILGVLRVGGFPPDLVVEPFTQVWFAGMIELIGGLGVMVGLQTRWLAFLCSGEMAVAYYLGHWHGQLGVNFLPVANGGELAVLDCFIFFFIAAHGPGKWAIDKKG